jgi:hypothetical protein
MWGPPHRSWLVVALLIQRERQRWHHAVCRGVFDARTPRGALPGHAGWRFQRHGCGILLSGPDGEQLDVDFETATGSLIDAWFFANRVASVAGSATRIAEPRLWRWRPSEDVIIDGISELADAGLVHYTSPYRNKVALAPELETQALSITAELELPEGRARWLALLEPGGEEAHLAMHRAWLQARVHSSTSPGDLLEFALSGTSADEARALCGAFLGRGDWHAGRAIELLRGRVDVPPMPELADVLARLRVDVDHPFAALQACAYLLERDLAPAAVRERFGVWAGLDATADSGGHPARAEFATLALEWLPDLALPLVRRALRDPVPWVVIQMAAMLAAIDLRWCHRELISAAGEPRETQAYVAAALRETTSELAQRYGRDTRRPTPGGPDDVTASFGELAQDMAGDFLAEELTSARVRAARLRARFPDDWNG